MGRHVPCTTISISPLPPHPILYYRYVVYKVTLDQNSSRKRIGSLSSICVFTGISSHSHRPKSTAVRCPRCHRLPGSRYMHDSLLSEPNAKINCSSNHANTITLHCFHLRLIKLLFENVIVYRICDKF